LRFEQLGAYAETLCRPDVRFVDEPSSTSCTRRTTVNLKDWMEEQERIERRTQGVHPRVVMETLGHSQVSLTLDTYSHVLPTLQAEAAKRMNDALGEIGCQNGCQTEDSSSAEPDESPNSGEKVVSRLGIEPRTRRLRVCCSAN
jgi:hypothetical protein